MKIIVRSAEPHDFEAIVAIAELSPYQPTNSEGLESIAKHIETGKALLATADETPAGYLLHWPHLWEGRPPFVRHIDVTPELQGQRIGRALMAGMERVAINLGFSAIYSSTAENNEGSRRFHESLGFSVDCVYPLRDQPVNELMLSKLVIPAISVPDNVDLLV